MVATGLYQYSLLDVIDIADIVDRDPAEVADTYFALMDHLGTDGLLTAVSRLRARRPLAFVGALGDSRRHLRFAAGAVLRRAGRGRARRERRGEDRRVGADQQLPRARGRGARSTEIYEGGERDLATLSVAARQIRSMTRTSGTGTSG